MKVSEIADICKGLIEAKQPEKALTIIDKYLEINDNGDLLNIKGVILLTLHRHEEAISYFRQALKKINRKWPIMKNLAVAYEDAGQKEKARQTLKIPKDDYRTLFYRANEDLLYGDYKRGFKDYKARMFLKDGYHQELDARLINKIEWSGKAIPGKTLLINQDAGHGDFIMLLRFLPEIIRRSKAKKIIIRYWPEMKTLLAASIPSDIVLSSVGDEMPKFDKYIHLFDVPHLIGLTLNSIPNQPYLNIPLVTQEYIRGYLPLKGKKIGICWQGSQKFKRDKERSIPLDKFITCLPKDKWIVVLQKGVQSVKMEGPPPKNFIFLSPYLRDFADTAAAIAQCDLIITVDTSVAHLAGAMGKPVWCLIRLDPPEWRWMLNRTDSPWYPSMRLFRQPKPGDWDSVLQEVNRELLKT